MPVTNDGPHAKVLSSRPAGRTHPGTVAVAFAGRSGLRVAATVRRSDRTSSAAGGGDRISSRSSAARRPPIDWPGRPRGLSSGRYARSDRRAYRRRRSRGAGRRPRAGAPSTTGYPVWRSRIIWSSRASIDSPGDTVSSSDAGVIISPTVSPSKAASRTICLVSLVAATKTKKATRIQNRLNERTPAIPSRNANPFPTAAAMRVARPRDRFRESTARRTRPPSIGNPGSMLNAASATLILPAVSP